MAENRPDLLAAALEYVARDWSVIPVGDGKRPAVPAWKQYQTQRPNEATIRQWFQRPKVSGVAVVCGAVSGGLTVRDYDVLDAYGRWAENHPDLAKVLPTSITARGRHVLFASGERRIIKLADGELRAGGYVLLPPSRHPSGITYRWQVPLDRMLPHIDDLGGAGLVPVQSVQREQSRLRHTEAIARGVCTMVPVTPDIDLIIASTLPLSEGKRNAAVFSLCRALKALPQLAECDPKRLKQIVQTWHRRALPLIATKDFTETWIDFLYGWPRVRYPKGADPMQMAFDRVGEMDLPAEAMQYEPPKLRVLVGLCAELQRQAGDEPFYLSCRTAQKVLDLDRHTIAARWLWLLVSDGVLTIAKPGTRDRAARYFYLPALGREDAT